MSAEVTSMDLDARRRVRSVDATLREADALLERTFVELSDALRQAAEGTGDGSSADPLRDLPGHDPGPLGVDLVGELADRARNHGKRLRPVLAHWGWAVAGGRTDSHAHLVRVAAALELLHLFALIQDDVMDRSASRRGLPTLHVVAAQRHREQCGLGDGELFGDSVATLVSDLALSEATMLVAGTSPEVRAAWRLMAVELVEGQLLDVTHTAGRRRDLPTSLRIARFKSGRYTITRPLQLGALVGGADPSLVRRLVTWGDLVGDAFAVRDDVLGVWGDPARTGQAGRRRPALGQADRTAHLGRRAAARARAPAAGRLRRRQPRRRGRRRAAAGDGRRRGARPGRGGRRRPRHARAPGARRPRRRPRGRRRAARPRRRRRLAVRVRVVVIGAGLSGLAAACHLTAAGHDVTVLEREAIVGGRAGELRLGDFRIDTGPGRHDHARAAARADPCHRRRRRGPGADAAPRPRLPRGLPRRQRAAHPGRHGRPARGDPHQGR